MSVLFVGPLGNGSLAWHGASAKNRLILEALEKYLPSGSVEAIDTERWRKNPWILPRIFRKILCGGFRDIIISTSRGSARRLIMLAYLCGKAKKMTYWVIGGKIETKLSRGDFYLKVLSHLRTVIVETEGMLHGLESLGLSNVRKVPNFRDGRHRETLSSQYIKSPIHYQSGNPFRFIFMARICLEKGVETLLEAVKRLIGTAATPFKVDFFGNIEPTYQRLFRRHIDDINSVGTQVVEYKGLLDLTASDGYKILSTADAMVFPTEWETEGFPGSLIDAFMASLPVIATDWNYNREILSDGEDSLIVPPGNAVALAEAMRKMVEGEVEIAAMRVKSGAKASLFDSREILRDEIMKFS